MFLSLQEQVQLLKLNHSAFLFLFFSPVALTPGLLKSEGPLLTLGGSPSEQASTSKQTLFVASGSRDDIFSLGGLSYLTSSKSCGSRSLGWVSVSHCRLGPISCLISPLLFSFPVVHKNLFFPGPPCWTGRQRAQEPPTRPCWRRLLCHPSLAKVSLLKGVLLRTPPAPHSQPSDVTSPFLLRRSVTVHLGGSNQ